MPAKRKKITGQDIIKNMGLFWNREQVRWRGDRGIGKQRLAGFRSTAKKQGQVDFWPQTGIYALYADYHLVYVGQAGLTDKSCLGNRLKIHTKGDLAGRWNMFSWFGLQSVNKTTNKLRDRGNVKISTRTELANVLEGILIEVSEPPMNSQKVRFGANVERYLQCDDCIDKEAKTKEQVLTSISTLEARLSKAKRQILKKIAALKRKSK